MSTAQDIINEASDTYPELLNHPDALALFNVAHNDVLKAVNLLPRGTATVALSITTNETAISPDIMEISTAVYQADATNNRVLRFTTIDELDSLWPLWRFATAGQPTRCYLDENNFGVVPIPLVATSGTYPRVYLTTRTRVALAVGDALPSHVNTYDAWVFALCAQWAIRRVPSDIAEWGNLTENAITRLVNYIYGRTPRIRTKLVLNIPWPRNP